MPEEVEHDDDAYWRREPLVRQRGLDDLDCAEVDRSISHLAFSLHGEGRRRGDGTRLTEAEHAKREQYDGEADEDGPGCACDSVSEAFKGLEAAKDLSCAASGHSSNPGLRGTQRRSRQRGFEARCSSEERRTCA